MNIFGMLVGTAQPVKSYRLSAGIGKRPEGGQPCAHPGIYIAVSYGYSECGFGAIVR